MKKDTGKPRNPRKKKAAAAAKEPPVQDYTKLHGKDLTEALGQDPEKWAEAALAQANMVGGHITKGFLRDWFKMALAAGKKG